MNISYTWEKGKKTKEEVESLLRAKTHSTKQLPRLVGWLYKEFIMDNLPEAIHLLLFSTKNKIIFA